MRKIKFRAWNTYAKEWQTEYVGLDCAGNLLGRSGDTDYVPTPQAANVLMQFTGLKDKNGNEIYEGDIARRARPLTPAAPLNAAIVDRAYQSAEML
jgi:uncharacterized phage protein (TIGR01671 family)